MAKIKLTLSPTQPAVWKIHPDTGAEFEIMPLSGDVDEELLGRCRNMIGQVDIHTFGQLVAPKIIRNWRGVGGDGVEEPCNEASLKKFVSAHCRSILPWILGEARSLDNYREDEVGEAKNA